MRVCDCVCGMVVADDAARLRDVLLVRRVRVTYYNMLWCEYNIYNTCV